MKTKYLTAVKELEIILNREFNKRGSAPAEVRALLARTMEKPGDSAKIARSLIYIKKDLPNVKVGEHQVVLNLGGGYVAKGRRLLAELQSHYVIGTSFLSYSNETNHFIETEKILQELGYNPPPHKYIGMKLCQGSFRAVEKGTVFALVPDVTEGGKYSLEETTEENFAKLTNSQEIRKIFSEAMVLFKKMDKEKHPLYCAWPSSHVSNGAYAHIFQIRINPKDNIGALIPIDLDHTYLFRKEPRHKK